MANSVSRSHVVIAYDATKDRGVHELNVTVHEVILRGDILLRGDTLVVLGVLHKVANPMGYQVKACPDSFAGASSRVMEEEVTKKLELYGSMLSESGVKCEKEGIGIEVKVTAGTPIKQVILQEVVAFKATWVVLDRCWHFRKDLRYYLKQIPCKVALIQDNKSVVVVKSRFTNETEVIQHKWFFSQSSKPIPLASSKGGDNSDQSVISCKSHSLSFSSYESSDMYATNLFPSTSNRSRERNASLDIGNSSKQDRPGTHNKEENKHSASDLSIEKYHRVVSRQRSSEAPILCSACGARTELYIKDSMRFSFPEIQLATDNFSKENLLGEGGYGHVYKGKLKDGQLIAAKVRKEASTQGFAEFHSEVYVLNFARHKNIVMLLGFCCKENLNILVYEYICNKSLDWHLFDSTENVLEWHQRHAIAIGIAKGLRFLHEECRGGPIIHRDMRPSNVLLTHDFVPMLGDFGLARWKTGDDPVQTRILGTLGYLAPEYAESGIVSVRTDVYAFGIVLLQLISGRKVVDDKRQEGQQSLRQWAESVIERLALHELIDARLGDSYDTYELYLMAKAAYLCVQRNPELRPSMGEVIHLLEGENDQIHRLGERFAANYAK
ncbi:hypothetical protein Tsubulata_002083 [Turnera subulata]|uniref:Protein kinase domain-containing protein n=1 Tax=Turnera subulata TaxID=218843 RepID=A0A9Q0G163_9ROSI|nr:hypothetical protein Tsubulata_002083 [Turnera subulata]